MRVNLRSPVLRRVLGAPEPDPRGPGWAPSQGRRSPGPGPPERASSVGWTRPRGESPVPRAAKLAEPGGAGRGIAPGRPAGIRRAVPVKTDHRTRGEDESLNRLKNIRALAEARAAARASLATSPRCARLLRSSRGRGAPASALSGERGCAAPQVDRPCLRPAPGLAGAPSGRGRAGLRARRPLGSGPRERSARSAT